MKRRLTELEIYKKSVLFLLNAFEFLDKKGNEAKTAYCLSKAYYSLELSDYKKLKRFYDNEVKKRARKKQALKYPA